MATYLAAFAVERHESGASRDQPLTPPVDLRPCSHLVGSWCVDVPCIRSFCGVDGGLGSLHFLIGFIIDAWHDLRRQHLSLAPSSACRRRTAPKTFFLLYSIGSSYCQSTQLSQPASRKLPSVDSHYEKCHPCWKHLANYNSTATSLNTNRPRSPPAVAT